MTIFLAVLLLSAAVLVILLFIAWKCLMLIVRPARRNEDEVRESEIKDGFEYAIDAYENRWKTEEFLLHCDGADILGEIIENPDASVNKVAIVCHGHTVNRYTSLKYADIFYRQGFHVVIYDERYFGQSTGDYCTLGQNETDDLLKVYEMTTDRFPGCRIVLHGESMGAATVLLSLRRIAPDAVIADCPFCDSERLFREYIKKNLRIPQFLVIPLLKIMAALIFDYHISEANPLQSVRAADVPICLFHGTADMLIDCDHSVKLQEAFTNPKSRLHLFEGAGHADSILIDRKRYEQLLLEFLKDCGL